jgi:Putative cyclase
VRYHSAVAWIDVSVPLRTGMVTFEGDPDVRIEPATRIAAGDLANVSRMELGTHSGTHMDAPRHFIDGAPGIDRIPLDALVGPALVADARGVPGDIDADALATLGVPAGTEPPGLRARPGSGGGHLRAPRGGPARCRIGGGAGGGARLRELNALAKRF